MQIFASDPSPYISAIVLDDKRLGKAIIESAQILSSVWGGPYRKTHINHPAMLWVRADWRNYKWLLQYYNYLDKEWEYRFHKPHAAGRWVQFFIDMLIKNGYYTYGWQSGSFCNMTRFKDIKDTHEAYKMALIDKWNNGVSSPKWTNREKPVWYNCN